MRTRVTHNRYHTTGYSILLFLLTALPVSAQQSNQPYLECRYVEKYMENLNKPDRTYEDEWALRLAKDCSEFYSVWNNAHWALKDSIFGKGGTLDDWYAARESIPYPTSTQTDRIYKNYPTKGRLTHVVDISTDWYKYEIDLETPAWEILKETKTVAGYMCQKARTEFLGRTWVVWFAVELPVSDGPWKLHGLPGLILEAHDAEDEFHFTCIEIRKPAGDKPVEIPKKKYIKCTKEKMIELLTLYENNINDYLKLRGIGPIRRAEADGSLNADFMKGTRFNYIER